MQPVSPCFSEALEILRQVPIPDDALDRLEALEDGIYPEERERFGDLVEAAIAGVSGRSAD